MCRVSSVKSSTEKKSEKRFFSFLDTFLFARHSPLLFITNGPFTASMTYEAGKHFPTASPWLADTFVCEKRISCILHRGSEARLIVAGCFEAVLWAPALTGREHLALPAPAGQGCLFSNANPDCTDFSTICNRLSLETFPSLYSG